MAEHYVESFRDDSGEFGWQCFTCREEATGLEDFDAADVAADEHRIGADTGPAEGGSDA